MPGFDVNPMGSSSPWGPTTQQPSPQTQPAWTPAPSIAPTTAAGGSSQTTPYYQTEPANNPYGPTTSPSTYSDTSPAASTPDVYNFWDSW